MNVEKLKIIINNDIEQINSYAPSKKKKISSQFVTKLNNIYLNSEIEFLRIKEK
uniref:Uncharacterized protein n=1 Tax=Meloidogyne enterolobii TaxID=390850 RepID=A0A6V7VIH9_MELEN|nr:unnamed protein product [Meloidogyne enterolobii]